MDGYDVVVAEATADLGFFDEELLAALGLECAWVHEFQCYDFVDEGIVCFVDDAHAAFTNFVFDRVAVGNAGAVFVVDVFDGSLLGLNGDFHGRAAGKANAFPSLHGDGDGNLQSAL